MRSTQWTHPLEAAEEEGAEYLVELGHHPLAVLLVDDVVHRRVLPDVLEPEPVVYG